ncbi:hypothetical protein AXK56_04120 [Tsukamurella pulmonis]|uniref:Lactose phosphotransferase system repressor n=1 Tax=Tsukamurella pulmonis TaxID=47312 RepID=A0A1H1DMI6_9ACTN|nr:DeoR/GlpR family DNA-binding transcription regulator [Tsukamurella pulmonis]KXO92272.1 hypothetical protein AXK56_04120 [Tsukamurella pulmonis]SDQ77751.1 DNA-binding transcriptional regulator of sugar metabolism, DeoR/GlpR family [Tsukamurella pulmonis]SUP21894.1 Glycerol-3-phosphate regulon repressor [Tsukamurella pulmonis]
MDRADRLDKIRDQLRIRGELTFDSIAREYGISSMTARRDIEALERHGDVRRVRHGAVYTGGLFEPPFADRMVRNDLAKRAIGMAARDQIADGDTFYVDSGTTAIALASAIADRPLRGTMITPNLTAASIVAGCTTIWVEMIGGRVRSEELTVVGPDAVDRLREFRFDTAFLGVARITAAGGASDYGIDETRVKQAAATAARRRIILADTTKLDGSDAAVRVLEPRAIDLVITDADPRSEPVRALVDEGIGVLHA